MKSTVEKLQDIGDLMLRLGDLRKARVIHDAVKLCTVWHSTSDALPDKDGAYLCIGNTGTVHTAHYYARAHKFSNKFVRWWTELPAPPEV